MIWPNLRIGSSSPMAAIAILCPLRIRSRALVPLSGAVPTGISSTAMRTLSDAFRRKVRGVAMASAFPVFGCG